MNADLIHLFTETFDISPDKLLPEATLESLGLDSLAVIEFIFQIEDFDLPEDCEKQALAAVEVLGLDFGAVDVVYNAKDLTGMSSRDEYAIRYRRARQAEADTAVEAAASSPWRCSIRDREGASRRPRRRRG